MRTFQVVDDDNDDNYNHTEGTKMREREYKLFLKTFHVQIQSSMIEFPVTSTGRGRYFHD